jgi:DNA-binding NarL/FixJ family response regulator
MRAFTAVRETPPVDRHPLPLSNREREVSGLVLQGLLNKEIAAKLFISEQTVKNHLHNIFEKLGVSNRLELALYIVQHQDTPV